MVYHMTMTVSPCNCAALLNSRSTTSNDEQVMMLHTHMIRFAFAELTTRRCYIRTMPIKTCSFETKPSSSSSTKINSLMQCCTTSCIKCAFVHCTIKLWCIMILPINPQYPVVREDRRSTVHLWRALPKAVLNCFNVFASYWCRVITC